MEPTTLSSFIILVYRIIIRPGAYRYNEVSGVTVTL
jgi:hypothetical protein